MRYRRRQKLPNLPAWLLLPVLNNALTLQEAVEIERLTRNHPAGTRVSPPQRLEDATLRLNLWQMPVTAPLQ